MSVLETFEDIKAALQTLADASEDELRLQEAAIGAELAAAQFKRAALTLELQRRQKAASDAD